MDRSDKYAVKDMSLAEQGHKNIAWAEQQMGALLKIRKQFREEKPLQGIRIGICLHITKETGILLKTLIAGGGDVAACSCNPLSTQDDVAAALAKDGVKVWAYKGESKEDYYRYLKEVIQHKPHITIDDGCDLVTEIHLNHKELLKKIIGGCEETTTGVIRLHAMEKDNALKYPMVAVNDSKTKHLMDNFIGTGQSTIDGILRATNVLIAGKTVVVSGYGSCGKGVSKRASGLGANVVVVEVDPFRALQAAMDGYRVMPMEWAASFGDIFVTVTGNKHVIALSHMKKMKHGAILANAGHFDIEIDLKSLAEASTKKESIRPFMDSYTLGGKTIYVLGEGRLINLAAAEGHPSTIMSMSFCNQAMACDFLVKNRGRLENRVYVLPDEADQKVSRLQLETMGITIDALTEEQKKYMSTWKEGT